MLFFRPQRPSPKLDSDATEARTDTSPTVLTPEAPSDGSRYFHGFRLWPAILISVLLWVVIIFVIRWLVG